MRTLTVLIVAVALLLTGCLSAEMHVQCRGKGAISANAGPYGGILQGDCGDGFEYHRQTVPFKEGDTIGRELPARDR